MDMMEIMDIMDKTDMRKILLTLLGQITFD